MSIVTQLDPLNTGLVFLPVQFSRNQIEHVLEPADTNLPDRSGLRYFLELLVPEFAGSSQFKRLVKMPGSERPPNNGSGSTIYEGCFFQIDELLDGFLEYQKPDFKQLSMAIIAPLTMPYIARETVENNGVLLPASTREKAIKWVLKAGLLERDFTAWNSSFFTDYMSQNRPFLTWQPNYKTIGENQEEFLYFLFNCSPIPAKIIRRYRVHYVGGNYEVLESGQLSGVQPYQVVCVPVSMAALNLQPKLVESVEVWLSDGDRNRISQIRTYKIDHTYRSQERFILFSNSLGGWDTLRLTGAGFETLETTRTTAELERPAGAPSDFAELRVIHLQGSRTLQVSTGWFEQESHHQLKYLDELMLAEEIYLVDSRGHQALELLTNSLIDKEDNTDLLARSFTFRMATPQVNYSAMPAAPATVARPVGWRGSGVVQVLDSFGKRTGKGRPLKLQKYYLDTGETFKPLTEKPNQPGDPNYQDSLPIPGVTAGDTPYPSQVLSKTTTYKRATCTGGQIGEVATIVVPAGKYGSELNQADANAKAAAEYTLLNTQAYADQYGSCTNSPELYAVAVPAGQWHYRANDASRLEIYWFQYGSGQLTIGNSWSLQGENREFVFPRWSNDLNFPTRTAADWIVVAYGTPFTQVQVQIYNEGVLVHTRTMTTNQDGFEQFGLPIALASTNKLYFKVTTV